MADTDESLDVDDKGYPLLPDEVLGLRLRRKKAIMRQFMGAVRRMCYYHRHRIEVLMNDD
jgi:hypothetical protein